MNLIIDTDMGFDDVMAIAMLVGLDVPIAGITTVTGLCHPEQGARNALALLERMGRADIPVAVGSASPLEGDRHFPEEWRIEAEALLGIPIPSPTKKPHPQAASDFIAQYPDEVTLLCLGPLTNVALALRSSSHHVKQIVMMGGAVRVRGNVGDEPSAEWNVYIDPTAAAQVIASGVPVTMVGLDVTNQAPANAVINELKRIPPAHEAGKVILESLDHMYGYFFDPVTAACIVEPSIITTEAMRMTVDKNGMTHEGMEGQSINVGLALDFARFQEVVERAVGSRGKFTPRSNTSKL